MEYKLFTEFITLQALLKELGIIQSGGAIKNFLANTTVLFNGEDEKRRGKKIRIDDVVSIPSQQLDIKIVEPCLEEKEAYSIELAEKERVAALVKQMNQKTKQQKNTSKPNVAKGRVNSKKPIRFPGI